MCRKYTNGKTGKMLLDDSVITPGKKTRTVKCKLDVFTSQNQIGYKT
jgi:hypothetical protein